MEGQGEGMALSVPGGGDTIHIETLSNKSRSQRSNGRAKKIIEINGWKTDPSRHGL